LLLRPLTVLMKYSQTKRYTTDEKAATKRGLAWEIETGSILIKEKCKHLSKTSDKVSKMLKRKHLKFEI
jgi:hypothetical protein